jgi:hypothetical protein
MLPDELIEPGHLKRRCAKENRDAKEKFASLKRSGNTGNINPQKSTPFLILVWILRIHDG